MNQTTKVILGIVIAIVVIWGGYTLLKGPQEAVSPGPAVSTEPIKIGVSLPLTGEAASFGEGGKPGAELAAKEINQSGGINGRMIELVFEDDKCSKDGASVFNKLVNIDKVTAIIGSVCSAAVGPGAPIAQKAGVPTIIWGSAPPLPKIGDYIFRTYPSDAFQGKFAAEFVVNVLKKSSVAVLYVKNDWGQGIRDVFVPRFEELGGKVVYDEGVAQDTKDLRSFVTKIKAANPDIIYFPAYPAIGVIGLKQMRDLGLNAPVLGGDAFETDEIVKSGVAEDVMYTAGVIRNPEEFKTRVKNELGKDSNLMTPLAYDAVKILATVFAKVGTEKSAVRNELAGLSYKNGISLPVIEFDEDGDLKSAEFEVKVIKGGNAQVYAQ